MTSTDRKIVTPTVGRKVWFRLNGSMQKLPCADGRVVLPELCGIEQPMDATVIFVHGTRMVNLDITDHIGQRFVARSVPLLQDGDLIPDAGFYCEWMPYQKSQAAKTEVAVMASGIVIPPIGAPSAGTTAASFSLPVIDPGPDSLEREIQAKADNGPRVTPFEVEAHIRSEFYFTAEQGVLGESELGTRPASWTNMDQVTICVLILTNGTKIVGVNEGPVSRENFKADLGRQYARQKAVDQIWPLLGFRLRDELSRPVLTDADAAADLAGTPRP